MRSSLWQAVFFGAILALFSGFGTARADFLATETSMVTPIIGGEFLYSYTVTVSANSTVYASEFDLSLPGTIDTNSIINPSNFTSVYSPGDSMVGSSISFYAVDNGTNNSGISPGSSGTFSFLSVNAPTMGAYQALGFDQNLGILTLQGSAVVPSVPEPSSLLMSGFSLCGALGLFVRSRRRPTA